METRRRSPHRSLELFWNEEGAEGMASRGRSRCKDPGVGLSKSYRALVKDERRRKRDPTEHAKAGAAHKGAWIVLGNTQKQKSSGIRFPESPDPSQRCLISIFHLTWPKGNSVFLPPNLFFPISVNSIFLHLVTEAKNPGILLVCFLPLFYPPPPPSSSSIGSDLMP